MTKTDGRKRKKEANFRNKNPIFSLNLLCRRFSNKRTPTQNTNYCVRCTYLLCAQEVLFLSFFVSKYLPIEKRKKITKKKRLGKEATNQQKHKRQQKQTSKVHKIEKNDFDVHFNCFFLLSVSSCDITHSYF